MCEITPPLSKQSTTLLNGKIRDWLWIISMRGSFVLGPENSKIILQRHPLKHLPQQHAAAPSRYQSSAERMSVPDGTLVKPVTVQKVSHLVAQSYECTCYCYRQVCKGPFLANHRLNPRLGILIYFPNMKEEEECSNYGAKSCLDKLPIFHRFRFKRKPFTTTLIDVYRNSQDTKII